MNKYKNKIIMLSALSIPIIYNLGNYKLDVNATNDEITDVIQTRDNLSINSYRIENVTDEGFDFIIKFNSNKDVTGLNLQYWKYGNYNGRKTTNSTVKIATNEYKIHIKMKDIGSGTEYVNFGIYPTTSEGNYFIADINVKLDTTNPNLNLSLSNTNWTNKDISLNAISNDNQNIIENLYFYDKYNNVNKKSLYSNPKILLIKHPSGSVISERISYQPNVTTVLATDINSVNQLKGYDIVIYDGYAWGVTANIDTYLNQAFEQGVSIITNFNDNMDNLSIGYSVGSNESYQMITTYTNGFSGGGGGRTDRFAYLMEYRGEYDGCNYIKPKENAFIIANSTNTANNSATPGVLMMTHSNGNKWIHSQTGSVLMDTGAFYRAVDEIMAGTMKTRQTYSNLFTVSENGTYSVEVEDFSGNKTKQSITVSNIDKEMPTLNITGNPTTWTKSATLKITGYDSLSGVKEIVLPNGTIVTSSTANYTATANGDYLFKIRDNAGNESTHTVNVTQIDNNVEEIEKVLVNMTMLDEDTSKRRLTVTFPTISDSSSGVKGYSYVIDKNKDTIPDNTVDTNTNTISKDITDTGIYYVHIKSVDNAGNVSEVKHHEIEIPHLESSINSKGTVNLNWNMNSNDQSYLYSVLKKRGDENEYNLLGDSKLRDRVNVLNIYPQVSEYVSINTWDGEYLNLPKSASLKQWMEQPNSESDKGYGMGIIEVIPLSIDNFNQNPNSYLYKATSGENKGKYITNIRGKEEVVDVVMFGSWDSNGNKDISDSGVTTITNYLENNGSVLFGHDTILPGMNFWKLSDYADVKPQKLSMINNQHVALGGIHVKAKRDGLIMKYPWAISLDEFEIPATHSNKQLVNQKDTWLKFSRPFDGIMYPNSWIKQYIEEDGYSNDAYLSIHNRVGIIQTGHTSGSATPNEEKVLANTLFYMSQMTTISGTDTSDELAIDVNNPDKVEVTGFEFLENNTKIKFNYNPSKDNGTEYKYYVKVNGTDDDSVRLSNTVSETITSGLKGYSYVIDNNPTTQPDDTVDTTSTSVTMDNNKSSMYLHIKAIDNAGNVSETTHYQLSDTTKPTISVTGNPTEWTNEDVTLKVVGTDLGSGVKHIVLPNGNIINSSTTSYTVSANGSYTFKVVDNMGNEISQTVNVTKIDKSINNITGLKQNMTMLNADTSTRKINLTFSPINDNQSGVKGYSYIIDKNPSTIPSNTVNTTSKTITKDITDSGLYYLHIKAIDNVGNVSNVIHYKIDIPTLTASANPKENNIRLDWTLSDYSEKTYKVFQKKPGSSEYQTVSMTNFDSTKQVRVLNIHPNMGSNITFTTWDGETLTLPKSASLKQWMEEPNKENPKGYGQGLIEVTPVTFEEYNANPDKYLKDSNGEYKYDVIMIGSWDSNGSKDFNAISLQATKEFANTGKGILVGHDTLRQASFPYLKELRTYANIETPGDKNIPISYESTKYSVVSTDVIKRKEGLLTNFPWVIDKTQLTVPITHTSRQWAYGDVWFDFTNINSSIFAGYEGVIYNGLDGKGTNNFYLTTYNNGAMIQTGHSNGSATSDEQKMLANTLFYLNQLSSENYLVDNSGQDLSAPNKPSITGHKFADDGYINVNFDEVKDDGSKYSYYVESTDKSGNDLTLSNTVTATITSGLKGYSYVVDSSPNTIPDNEIEQTTNETIKIKTKGDEELYVHIKAIDNVGNESETYHYRVTDTQSPTLTIVENPTTWTNGSVTLTATAIDTGSGVKYIVLPNGNKVSSYTASYVVDKNGLYYFIAVDYMGNETVKAISVTNIDKKKPTTTITNNQNWTNQDVQVDIFSKDE